MRELLNEWKKELDTMYEQLRDFENQYQNKSISKEKYERYYNIISGNIYTKKRDIYELEKTLETFKNNLINLL